MEITMEIIAPLVGLLLAILLIVMWSYQLNTMDAKNLAVWKYVAKLGIGLNMLSSFLFVIHLGNLLAREVLR